MAGVGFVIAGRSAPLGSSPLADVGFVIEGGEQLPEVVAHLDVLAGVFGDLRPLLEAIGQYGVTSTRDRFQTETGPDGQRWKPSARAEFDGGKTLTESGGLANSLTFNVLGNDSVEWGTNKIYGRIHQLGGVIKAKGAPHLRFQVPGGGWRTVDQVVMPARPYLGIDEEDEGQIGEIVQIVIEESFA